MTAPQLADANTSSEWFRKVGEAGAAEKPRTPSHAVIAPSGSDARRKRFVRLVTYTMAGLVAFTLLGVASFTWRQHTMQSALAAPVPVISIVPAPTPALAAEAPPSTPALAETPAAPAAPVAAAPAVAPVAARAPSKAASVKPSKKSTRSPFLSNVKSSAAKR
ncbi:MAG: hypothetical protein ABUL60_03835 [Myxococcales bacterium]